MASGTLSYDDNSGAYAHATVLVGTHDEEIGFAGFQAGIGYAARATRTISIDAGLVQTEYARRAGEALDLRYTEAYAGITAHSVTARAYYSPNYFADGHHTLYAELEGSVSPLANWNLNLHLGALTYLNDPPRYAERTRYDWRATVSRNLGAFEIYGSLSGRSSGRAIYSRSTERAVVAVGAAVAF